MSFRKLMGERFLALYGPPQTENPEGYFAEWRRVFDGMDAEVLSAATDLVIRQHRFANWPTIGECCEAVEKVAEHINARRARERLRLAPPAPPIVSRESRARIDALLAECKRNIARAAHESEARKP